jgi:hypothetical protein
MGGHDSEKYGSIYKSRIQEREEKYWFAYFNDWRSLKIGRFTRYVDNVDIKMTRLSFASGMGQSALAINRHRQEIHHAIVMDNDRVAQPYG